MTIEQFEKAKEILQDINEIKSRIEQNEKVLTRLKVDTICDNSSNDVFIIDVRSYSGIPVLKVFKNDFVDFLENQNSRLKMNKTILEGNLNNL